ncbi:hypothetical protein [Streptomyces sp. ISL-94]|uniref:hypothetical protein n=1 Tax=Streptomyces sp. ISL-94 TaxID=2819190 RepID=UPI001BE8189B|nr:hypothetical protein [Streptomyces sp. ISL-94]MBT2478655.1 hypothetical protein [Streptomyces sp. ISL-94]
MMDDHIPPGGASEEQALRGLLRGAVEGLEPSEGALERLRYAVPARRTLKRQVLVGAAAVALLAGTAIPAALHMTAAEAGPTEHSAMAGHGEQPGGPSGAAPSDPHQNGSGAHPRSSRSAGAGPGAGGITGQPAPSLGGFPSGGVTAGPSGGAGTSAGTGGATTTPAAGGGPYPPAAAAGVPGCGAEQLGVVGAARAPRADGKVYGSFKVTNVSARGCSVTGPDTVTAAAAAATVPGKVPGVTVVGHTAGDPASGLLPDPSAEAPVLVLPPNTAYEVRFAWVPSGEACTAESPDTGASAKPPQEQSGDAGTAPSGTAGATDPQTGAEPAAPAGVAVSHTPQTGSPTTQTTIPEACGGTLYRTGTIPVDSPPKP